MSRFDDRVERSVKSSTETVKEEIMDLLLDDDPRPGVGLSKSDLVPLTNILSEMKSEIQHIEAWTSVLKPPTPKEEKEDEEKREDPIEQEDPVAKQKWQDEIKDAMRDILDEDGLGKDLLDALSELDNEKGERQNPWLDRMRFLRDLKNHGLPGAIGKSIARKVFRGAFDTLQNILPLLAYEQAVLNNNNNQSRYESLIDHLRREGGNNLNKTIDHLNELYNNRSIDNLKLNKDVIDSITAVDAKIPEDLAKSIDDVNDKLDNGLPSIMDAIQQCCEQMKSRQDAANDKLDSLSDQLSSSTSTNEEHLDQQDNQLQSIKNTVSGLTPQRQNQQIGAILDKVGLVQAGIDELRGLL